jgi:hypothetical protein
MPGACSHARYILCGAGEHDPGTLFSRPYVSFPSPPGRSIPPLEPPPRLHTAGLTDATLNRFSLPLLTVVRAWQVNTTLYALETIKTIWLMAFSGMP